MADVSIDATIAANQTSRSPRLIAFTTADIGYHVYVDSNSNVVYSKTTDGGATWGAAVVVNASTSNICCDMWPDWWTPGDSGTLIHIWYFASGDDDVRWRTLDTSSDTLGTERVCFAGATAVAGRGTFVSGAKALSGYLYTVFDLDAGAERGLHRSTDGGTTWSADLADTFLEATIDQCLLLPAANTGDPNDILAVYHDASADALTLKLWDSSGAVASESVTIMALTENTTDSIGQIGFSASIRHSDGHIIIAAVSELDTGTSDHRVFDVNCTGPGSFTITELTAITTNIDDHYYPAVFIDQATDDIFVAFNGIRTGGETMGTATKVYYVTSTDNGANWSAGSTAYMEGAAALVRQVWAPLMGPRFYVSWRVGTTLVGNKVNSVTFATGYTLVAEAGSYAASGVAASLLLGHVLAAASGAYAVNGTNAGTYAGRAVVAEAGAYAVTGSEATLTYTPSNNHLLVADPGSYGVTGTAASVLLGRTVTADAGSYALTGTDASPLANHAVVAEAGSYAETGTAAGTLAGRMVAADPSSYAVTGTDAELTYEPATGYVLGAAEGAYAVTGTDASPLKGSQVAADTGAYVVTGTPATFVHGGVPTRAIARSTGTMSIRTASTGTMPIRTRSSGSVAIRRGSSSGIAASGLSITTTYTMANDDDTEGLASVNYNLAQAPIGTH